MEKSNRLPADDVSRIVQVIEHKHVDFAQCRILVTGGTGFVGVWLLSALVKLRKQLNLGGMAIEILVRDPIAARTRLGDHLWGELGITSADINSDWELLSPVTHVIHGATPSSFRSGSADKRQVLLTSTLGTHKLIQAIERSGQSPRVLHLSSGAVYGPQPLDLARIPENFTQGPTPFSVNAPYAEGKRAAEALLEAASREGSLAAIQARLFAFLGPGLPTEEGYAIGNFMRCAANHEDVVVEGDGRAIRSYLAAHDLASWLLLLLVAGEPGTPYNVGSPYGHPLQYWAEQCAKLTGVGVRLGDTPLGERQIYVPSIENSEKLGIATLDENPEPALKSWLEWLRRTKFTTTEQRLT